MEDPLEAFLELWVNGDPVQSSDHAVGDSFTITICPFGCAGPCGFNNDGDAAGTCGEINENMHCPCSVGTGSQERPIFTNIKLEDGDEVEVRIAPETYQLRELPGLDLNDTIVKRINLDTEPEVLQFLRGDSNGDSNVNLLDAQKILNWLFLGKSPPRCMASADVNADGAVDLPDPQYLINYMFLGGPNPKTPFPVCGESTRKTDILLGCQGYVSLQACVK